VTSDTSASTPDAPARDRRASDHAATPEAPRGEGRGRAEPPALPAVGEADVEEFFRRLTHAEGMLDALADGELDAVLEPATAVPVLLSRAQQAIVRSEARHRDLVERCPSLVVELAPDGTVLFANEAARRLLGRRLEDLVGAHWWRAVATDAWRDDAIALETAVRHGDVTARELPLATRDGELRWVEWTSASRFLPDGTLASAVLFGLDVTERRRAADAARRLGEERAARAAAEAANHAKSEFLAMMSHELRTPLNAIAGHVQLLEMGLYDPITPAQERALGRVRLAQHRLLGLINDVLNYAKLEAGKVEFAVEEVSLADVVADVVPFVEPQLRAKGLDLTVELPPARRSHASEASDAFDVSGVSDDRRDDSGVDAGEHLLVWADREKLGQVLLNLLSNAVKFTPARQADGSPGQITVSAGGVAAPSPRVASDVGTAALLTVRDTGIGIPAERQVAVFEPFVQVHTGLTREHGGTGLGLAISRDLARGMGGDLAVESTAGQGARFTVSLRRVVTADGVRTDRRAREDRRSDRERRSGDERRHAAQTTRAAGHPRAPNDDR
jgi:PAS domain S-box-containing protein